jgi:hypothetical protein
MSYVFVSGATFIALNKIHRYEKRIILALNEDAILPFVTCSSIHFIKLIRLRQHHVNS